MAMSALTTTLPPVLVASELLLSYPSHVSTSSISLMDNIKEDDLVADELNNPMTAGFVFSSKNRTEIPHDMLKLANALQKYHNSTLHASKSRCDDSMVTIRTEYKKFHGYISLAVCLFGVVANILNMIVLTSTPVNLMLFALALADLLIMLEYIPYVFHNYILKMPPEDRFSISGARFVLFHTHFSQVLHTISIQLTLSMAIWRYFAMKSSTRTSTYCTFKRCYQVIAAAYICPLFLCILNYLYFQIHVKTTYVTNAPAPLDEIAKDDEEKHDTFRHVCMLIGNHDCTTHEVQLHVVDTSDLADSYPILHILHFWTFSVIIKLIPCFVLTFFMCWLVNTLYKARRHHKMLERNTGYTVSTVGHSEANHVAPEKQTMLEMKSRVITDEENHKDMKTSQEQQDQKKLKSNNCDDETTSLVQGSGKHIQIEDKGNGLNNTSHEVSNLSIAITTPSPCKTPDNVSATELADCGSQHLLEADQPLQNLQNLSPNSRRESEQSGDICDNGGASRKSKGFVRFPSIRRASHAGSGDKSPGKFHKNTRRTDRTSRMLIAVLVLFLVTELPQGMMQFLSGMYGVEFFRCYYTTWSEVFDALSLINSSINFLLYCFMSRQFRCQFKLAFSVDECFKNQKWISMANCNNTATVSTTV